MTIFTLLKNYPQNGGTWEYLFKWKPEDLNSIDCLIVVKKRILMLNYYIYIIVLFNIKLN